MQSAHEKLLCNGVVNFNLGINRPNLSAKHWIYFPENKFPFYRIGFTHNFSSTMVPEGCSGLYGEFSHLKQSIKTIEQTLQSARIATKQLLNIQESEILTEKIIRIPYAYVTYDFWREKNLPKLLERLEESSIYSIGRYGAWKYSSMQEALLEGKQIADRLAFMPATVYHASEQQTSTLH
jgi:protoporphyrinogen oxidase